MRHRNLTECVLSVASVGVLTEIDTVVQISRCSFDIHVADIVGTIMVAGSLVMLRPHGTIDIQYLINTIKQKQISFLHSVPTMLNALLNFLLHKQGQETLGTLRSICSIGECFI